MNTNYNDRVAANYDRNVQFTNIVDAIKGKCKTVEQVKSVDVKFAGDKWTVGGKEIKIDQPKSFMWIRRIVHCIHMKLSKNYTAIFKAAVSKAIVANNAHEIAETQKAIEANNVRTQKAQEAQMIKETNKDNLRDPKVGRYQKLKLEIALAGNEYKKRAQKRLDAKIEKETQIANQIANQNSKIDSVEKEITQIGTEITALKSEMTNLKYDELALIKDALETYHHARNTFLGTSTLFKSKKEEAKLKHSETILTEKKVFKAGDESVKELKAVTVEEMKQKLNVIDHQINQCVELSHKVLGMYETQWSKEIEMAELKNELEKIKA